MNEEKAGSHLSFDELVDYFSSGAQDTGHGVIERHLAVCDSCTQLGRRVYAATRLIDQWSKEGAHSQAARQILYPAMLALVEKTSDSTLKQRLKDWVETWSGRADGALRMVIESANSAAQIITVGMEGFLRPGARWQFALEPASAPSVRRLGPSKGAPISVAVAPGSPQATVTVMSDIGQVEVSIDHLAEGKKPPLVILASARGQTEPQVKEVGIVRASYGVATFEGVKAGEYLVLIEPTL